MHECFLKDGSRWLQGCYSDKDGLLSKYEVLNLKYQNINIKIVGPRKILDQQKIISSKLI